MSDDDKDKKFTQADIDRVVEDRLARERKKFEGFEDMKRKADELDELKKANQSDLEKANDRIKALESELGTAKGDLLRFEIAGAKGVKPRYLSGATREELEASADEYLKDHPKADGGGGEGEPSKGGPGGNATEDLKGGGNPDGDTKPVETDPAKLAESVPRGF